MKILIAHNFYRSSAPSGEDTVYWSERSLLEDKHTVISYEKRNDEIDDSTLSKKIRLGFNTAWSNAVYEEVGQILRRTRPDLAHFHNTFPMISPSAYAACRDNDVPVVQTVQNYRLVCPGALLLREGKPCEDCVGTSLLPALRHRCYRDSLTATGAVVWSLVLNRMRGTYAGLVNRYIAPTQFVAGKLVSGGLPQDRVKVKSNFLPHPPTAGSGLGGYALFVGRLSPEKGLRTLLDAWSMINGLPLRVAGDGPLRRQLEAYAKERRLPVEFLGYQSHKEVVALSSDAAFLVVPSEWYEGFPMVIVEAYACGTPVIASKIGSLDEVVEEGSTGLKFEPGNSRELAMKATDLWRSPAKRLALRQQARACFERRYSANRNYHTLMAIYEQAIDDAGSGLHRTA